MYQHLLEGKDTKKLFLLMPLSIKKYWIICAAELWMVFIWGYKVLSVAVKTPVYTIILLQ